MKYILTLCFLLFIFVSCYLVAEQGKLIPSTGLKKKVVVITGVSRGIGLVTAKHLAEQGYIVYGTVRESSDTTQFDISSKQYPENLFKIVTSLTDEEAVATSFDAIIKKHGRIDVLINNAVMFLMGTTESTTVQEQKELFDLNFFGPVRTIQAVLPSMRERKNGMIINISSAADISPYSPKEVYSASKFALRGLSESLAATLSPWNIKVSIIELSSVSTVDSKRNPVGTRFQGKQNPYALFHDVEQSVDGDDPKDLAKFIESIIESPATHVRYQFGTFAEMLAKQVYVDPSGDESLKSNIEYYRFMGLLPE